jgi:peptide subunit release factor 1 (eRF1)
MTASTLTQQLDRLARLEPCHPMLTLYLNTDVDGTGKRVHDVFLRKALPEILRQYVERSAEREQLERARERIDEYLVNVLKPATRGVAIFACEAMNLFEACQLRVPFDRSQAIVGDRPHLYPLARVCDQYPRCAAIVIDTHTARIFVFSAGATEQYLEVQNPKTKHTKSGGWAQARLQRHTENAQLLHVKEVIARLETLLRANSIGQFVIAGDDVVIPRFKEQMTQFLTERLVDVVRLDIRSPEPEVLAATTEVMRRLDAARDLALVEQLIGDSRSGGRAVVGMHETRRALRDGRVETLVIAATPEHVPGSEAAADELVAAARQTSAAVHFVEDPSLMRPVGGVAARLRFTA